MFVGAAAIALGSCLTITTLQINSFENAWGSGNSLAFFGTGLTGELLSVLSLVSDDTAKVHLLIMIFLNNSLH